MTDYTYAGTWLPIATTQATAYAAVKAVSDGFDAVNWALTSDTGQIDITTASGGGITIPTTAAQNTLVLLGYQIRALISTSGLPTIYCKLYYYVLAGTANTASTYRIFLLTQWGTSTDGAGNLSGVTGLVLGSDSAGATAASYYSLTVNRPFYVASDGENYITFNNDPNAVGRSTYLGAYSCFGCERSIDPDTGAYDAAGWQAIALNVSASSSTNRFGTAYSSSSATATSLTSAIPVQAIGGNRSSTGSELVVPITVFLPPIKAPMSALMGCYSSDIAAGATISATVYGVTRTYIISDVSCVPILGGTSASNASARSGYGALAFRYG